MVLPGISRQSRSIPLGLLGMLALIIMVETFLAGRGKLTTNLAETWRIKGQEASRKSLDCGLLCFGDSLLEFSILPRILGERLQLRSYNLALPGGTPASSYFLLKRTLESGSKPRAVLVNFMPFQLDPPAQLEEARRRTWPELASLGDTIDLAWSSRDIDLGSTTILAKILTSYRARLEIRAEISSLLRHKPDSPEFMEITVHNRNRFSNRGAIVIPSVERKADAIGFHSDLIRTRKDPVAVAYLDRFLTLAGSRRITVYWLIPPISPEYQAHCDVTGTTDNYTAYVKEKAAQHPGVVVIDGRHSEYMPELFHDAMHLNRPGATTLTSDLADILAHSEDLSPWVELPRYHKSPESTSVEDMIGSLATVQSNRAKLRR